MCVQKRLFLSVLFVCVVASGVVFPVGSRSQSKEPLQWGSAVDGIQLSLSASRSSAENGLELHVEVRNNGEHDVTLNLGSMLANGKTQLPDNISLILLDAAGKNRTFKFMDRNHSFIAGRRDDYVVPLRAGSIYTLRLTLDQFWCAETNEFEVKLLSGRNQLTARFEGSEAKHVNLDMPGIKLMNFWLGKVQSNILVLER